jgi:hypothetical protein
MNLRYNIIFIPLLIICIAAVWYLSTREEEVAAARRLADRALVDIELFDILEVTREDETIRMEKTGSSGEGIGAPEDWQMVQPYNVGVDASVFTNLMEGIFVAESERDIFDVTPEQQADYGLIEPGTRVRLASSTGKVLMDLGIGRLNPSGTSRYAAFTDNLSTCFLVPIYYIRTFEIDAEELRDVRAVPVDPEEFDAIQLSSSIEDIFFVKQSPGFWHVMEPSAFAASPARISQLFRDIQELKATEFLPVDADDPALNEELVEVHLSLNDGTMHEFILHGETESYDFYATSSWQPTPFIVEPWAYDRLALDSNIFFHVLLIDFAVEEIERVLVRRPGSSNLEILRTGNDLDDWIILRPENHPGASRGDLIAFMTALLNLQPMERIPDPRPAEEYGLDPSFFIKIEAYRENDLGKAEVYIGARDSSGDFYATQDPPDNRTSFFFINDQLVDEFLSATVKLSTIYD